MLSNDVFELRLLQTELPSDCDLESDDDGDDGVSIGKHSVIIVLAVLSAAFGVGKSSLIGEVMAALVGGNGGAARRIEICGASSMMVWQCSCLRACAGANVVGASSISAITVGERRCCVVLCMIRPAVTNVGPLINRGLTKKERQKDRKQ